MSTVAFLAAIVDPRVASAAAKAAMGKQLVFISCQVNATIIMHYL